MLEISPVISKKGMSYKEALFHCFLLGDNWRLPTTKEKKLYFDKTGDFVWMLCWSDEYEDDYRLLVAVRNNP